MRQSKNEVSGEPMTLPPVHQPLYERVISPSDYIPNELDPEFAVQVNRSINETVKETNQHVDDTVPKQLAREVNKPNWTERIKERSALDPDELLIRNF